MEGLATGAAVVCPPWLGTSVWGSGGCGCGGRRYRCGALVWNMMLGALRWTCTRLRGATAHSSLIAVLGWVCVYG